MDLSKISRSLILTCFQVFCTISQFIVGLHNGFIIHLALRIVFTEKKTINDYKINTFTAYLKMLIIKP